MLGPGWQSSDLQAMVASLGHRGPDDQGRYESPAHRVGLGHTRLSIIDLSSAGHQPMSNPDGTLWLVFNGEIYNHIELRAELGDYPFRSRTDSEVVLAAYERWGEECLHRFIGMFAFAIWDQRKHTVWLARDRFGVKPLYLHQPSIDALWFASEIKALHAAGVARTPDQVSWATYLATGMYDHQPRSFWSDISNLPAGTWLRWSAHQEPVMRRWYDPAEVVGRDQDRRLEDEVMEELLALLEESVQLRFRADVPVGICLSGGLDSSLLLALVHRVHGPDSAVRTFTFTTGDPAYDETPWVQEMLAQTRHPASFCRLQAAEVPALAARVQEHQDEPFGGLPTLAMAGLHATAKAEEVTVLLDGNGLDEGWAGYEYYTRATGVDFGQGPVQGSKSQPVRPDCLVPELAAEAARFTPPRPFGSPIPDLQYRDLLFAKIPRAMRFADRVSMMHSRELREPFLDHRIIELGLRQNDRRKVRDGQGKWLLRRLAKQLLPAGVREAPKRPLQTPQREWLQGPLRWWVDDCIETILTDYGGIWLDPERVRATWQQYCEGKVDNSFFVWQWISLALVIRGNRTEVVPQPSGAGVAT
jgi:asparagine synthase (glutamine-hydrolysing)